MLRKRVHGPAVKPPAAPPRRAFASLVLSLREGRLVCRVCYSGGEMAPVASAELPRGAWVTVDVTVTHGGLAMRLDDVLCAPPVRIWRESDAPPAPHIPGAFMLGAAACEGGGAAAGTRDEAAPVVVAHAWVQPHAWGERAAGVRVPPPPPAALGAALVDEVAAAHPARTPEAVVRALALLCDGVTVSSAVAAAFGAAGTRGGGSSLARAALDVACDARAGAAMRVAALRAARRLALLPTAVMPPESAAGATSLPSLSAPYDDDASGLVERLWGLLAAPAAARAGAAAAAAAARGD